MVLVIGAVVCFAMLYLLGVDVAALLNIVQIILTVVTALCALFFVSCDVLLLFCSKKHPAQLAGIEKVRAGSDKQSKEGMMSKAAFYNVNGEKLRNWFPAETLMSKKIYEHNECYVRIARLGKMRLVFDRHSVVIVVTGTILMGAVGIGFSVYWMFVLGLL